MSAEIRPKTNSLLAFVEFNQLLLGALIAGKKFVILAFVALSAFLKKLFSGRRKEETEPSAAE